MVAQKPEKKTTERRGEDRRKENIEVEVDRRKNANRRVKEDRRQKER